MLRTARYALLALLLSALWIAPATFSLPAHAERSANATATALMFDRTFIDMMVPHHQSAVAMAQIALGRAQHAEIRTLGRSIITDQKAEISTMRQWRKIWFGSAATPGMMHMPPLPGLMMSMNTMVDMQKLRTVPANSFDSTFMTEMIPHHQMAVQAARLEVKNGFHWQLKALAMTIIASQSKEVGVMKTYLHVWYGMQAPV